LWHTTWHRTAVTALTIIILYIIRVHVLYARREMPSFTKTNKLLKKSTTKLRLSGNTE